LCNISEINTDDLGLLFLIYRIFKAGVIFGGNGLCIEMRNYIYLYLETIINQGILKPMFILKSECFITIYGKMIRCLFKEKVKYIN